MKLDKCIQENQTILRDDVFQGGSKQKQKLKEWTVQMWIPVLSSKRFIHCFTWMNGVHVHLLLIKIVDKLMNATHITDILL